MSSRRFFPNWDWGKAEKDRGSERPNHRKQIPRACKNRCPSPSSNIHLDPLFVNSLRFVKKSLVADPWGGLFRAATTFAEAPTGAKKSVGHGGSPKECRLRLAWSDAPTSKMTSGPRGRLKPMRPFPVADSSETSPGVGIGGKSGCGLRSALGKQRIHSLNDRPW
jgi:hypothetical protein